MPSNIPPPRVPMIDARSGLVNRNWYTFFLNLFDLADAGKNSVTLTDLQQAPPVVSGGSDGGIPAGMIAFFMVSTPPDGWEEVTELRGRFPRGMLSGGTPGVTGGNADHAHEVTGGTMGAPNTVVGVASGSSYNVANGDHIHSYYDITSKALNAPLYLDGMWCRKL